MQGAEIREEVVLEVAWGGAGDEEAVALGVGAGGGCNEVQEEEEEGGGGEQGGPPSS